MITHGLTCRIGGLQVNHGATLKSVYRMTISVLLATEIINNTMTSFLNISSLTVTVTRWKDYLVFRLQ